MAISLGNSVVFGSSSANGGTSSAISVTAGQLLLAFVITGSSGSTTITVTSSRSDVFTAIGTQTVNTGSASGGNPFKVCAFRCASAVGGSTTFTVSDGGGGGFPTLIVQCYNNAAYDSIASAYAVQNGTSPFVSANITTNANNGWLISGLGTAQNSNPTYTAGNGFTKDVNEQNNSFWTCALGHKAYSGAVTDHGSWTSNITPTQIDATTITFAIRDTGSTPVNLTGISATAAEGSFVPRTRGALSGVAGTAGEGTLAPRSKPALLSVAATAALGLLAPVTLVGLSGVSGAAALGTLASAVGAFLIGIGADGHVGTLAPTGTIVVNLTGVQSTAGVGSLTPRSYVQASGVQAAGQLGALQPRMRVALSGVVATPSVGTFAVSIAPMLQGAQAAAHVGSFLFDPPTPKLVSITFTNVGLAATVTFTHAGLQATTTVTDL